MHPRTFYKHLRGGVDMRQFNARSATESRMSVDHFFTELWLQCAEDLPEDGVVTLNADADQACSEERVPKICDHVPHWEPLNDIVHAVAANGAEMLLRPKNVQYQRLVDLWWQYVAWADERCHVVPRASYLTFWRRWHDRWRHIIKIRKWSQHATCQVCNEYSSYIHYTQASAEKKQRAAKLWREHLREQYRDRLIYWNLRQWSRQPESNVLTIIIDSMDKTKAAWPQYTFQKDKRLDKFIRPKLVITVVIAHGYCTDFYVADDEVMFHGASTFCEILVRTLERVRLICESRGQSMPQHLVVQSDNTTAQAKNEEVTKLLAILVRKFKFHSCIINYLRVGHTHDDADQMFAVLLSLVLHRFKFQRPCELVQAIEAGMYQVVADRGEELKAYLLTHIRDFQSWMDVLHLTPYSCFVSRAGTDAPHSFMFKFRMDLSHGELVQVTATQANNARRFVSDPLDVYCITKHFMASTSAAPPVLVIPNERFGRLSPAPGGTCYKNTGLSHKRRDHLRSLADALEAFTGGWANQHSYLRAAADLRVLVNGREECASRDGYLERSSDCRAVPLPQTDNPYFGSLPNRHWRMRVRFGQ